MALIAPENWKPQGISGLEERAWDALRENDRSVLVMAGAGAGKTEFLAQKATYLLQSGRCPDPKRILAISFKRDAARNLADRVQKRCPPQQARRLDSMTFDGFTKGLLDRFRSAIPAPFTLSSDYQIVFPRNQDYDEFLQRHGYHGVNRTKFERALSTTPLPIDAKDTLSTAVSNYWAEQFQKAGDVSLSFSMINRLVEWLLRANPSIQRALRLTYPFVFLDEFQDTTYAQYDLLKRAFPGSRAILTAVGDDKQRVMGWAGAMSDGFASFERDYDAKRIQLLSNWRSHEDLIRIQHAIASRLDPDVEYPAARGTRSADGDIAAIWEFSTNKEQDDVLAQWVAQEIQKGRILPHKIAILVRMHANKVEERLVPAFSSAGIRLRNEARNVGEIAIQDLLGEDLTGLLLPLLRLASMSQSPGNWNTAILNLQYLEGIGSDDEVRLEKLHNRLEQFIHELRKTMSRLPPDENTARRVSEMAMGFVGIPLVRRSFGSYQKQADFDRVWEGFQSLMSQCATGAASWPEVLDHFEGVGQVVLMTIHKSKGLEFHTMIFYGLDDSSWWSLTPTATEELKAFYVAFTRAEQRAFFSRSKESGNSVTWIEKLLASAGVHSAPGKFILSKNLSSSN